MATLKFDIDSRGGFKAMRKAVAAARETALTHTSLYWTKEILPGHFKSANQARYGMRKRTERHKRRKRREGKSSDPNVYTGRLKQKMLSTTPSITIDKQGATVVFRGLPRYTFVTDTHEHVSRAKPYDGDDAYLKKLHPKHRENLIAWRLRNPKAVQGSIIRVERPDKVKELTAVDQADEKRLAKRFEKFFAAALKKLMEG